MDADEFDVAINTPLPCTVHINGTFFEQGSPLKDLVNRARRWNDAMRDLLHIKRKKDEELARLRPMTTWLMVSNIRPPVGHVCLLLHKSGTIYEGMMCYYHPDPDEIVAPHHYFVDVDEFNVDWAFDEIVAWMPKPTLPEGVCDDL